MFVDEVLQTLPDNFRPMDQPTPVEAPPAPPPMTPVPTSAATAPPPAAPEAIQAPPVVSQQQQATLQEQKPFVISPWVWILLGAVLILRR